MPSKIKRRLALKEAILLYNPEIEATLDSEERIIVEATSILHLLKKSSQHNVVTCVYCGHEYREGTPACKAQELTAHIKICTEHPMRALEEENERLREVIDKQIILPPCDFCDRKDLMPNDQEEVKLNSHKMIACPTCYSKICDIITNLELERNIEGYDFVKRDSKAGK
jgi:hypothetical protein